jgi:hypothetical protein
VRAPQPFLWREADLRRYVLRRLTTSRLSVCSQQPPILLYLDDEVHVPLFEQDLQLEMPVARVTAPAPGSRRTDTSTGEIVEEQCPPPTQASWHPAPPEQDSVERWPFEHLPVHGLLLEPFHRAEKGLREVYGRRA